jgi:hypothetical protein
MFATLPPPPGNGGARDDWPMGGGWGGGGKEGGGASVHEGKDQHVANATTPCCHPQVYLCTDLPVRTGESGSLKCPTQWQWTRREGGWGLHGWMASSHPALTAPVGHWCLSWSPLAWMKVIMQPSRGKASDHPVHFCFTSCVAAANVFRDGKRITLEADRLVPGDVVSIKSGDRLPADMRLLEVANLQVGGGDNRGGHRRGGAGGGMFMMCLGHNMAPKGGGVSWVVLLLGGKLGGP